MNRRRNYGFERRQKETTRRSRQEAKTERKADRAAQGEAGPEMGAPQEAGPPPEQWEWFSTSRGRVVATPEGQRPDTEWPDDWILLTETGEGPAPGDETGS